MGALQCCRRQGDVPRSSYLTRARWCYSLLYMQVAPNSETLNPREPIIIHRHAHSRIQLPHTWCSSSHRCHFFDSDRRTNRRMAWDIRSLNLSIINHWNRDRGIIRPSQSRSHLSFTACDLFNSQDRRRYLSSVSQWESGGRRETPIALSDA